MSTPKGHGIQEVIGLILLIYHCCAVYLAVRRRGSLGLQDHLAPCQGGCGIFVRGGAACHDRLPDGGRRHCAAVPLRPSNPGLRRAEGLHLTAKRLPFVRLCMPPGN